MTILTPMRPKQVLKPETMTRGYHVPGWVWQPKIDDERAVLRVLDGQLFNRQGQPFDRQKARPFAEACDSLRTIYGGHEWIDIGLIGYRDSQTFAASRGAVIVFDLPSLNGDPWVSRRQQLITRLPVLDLIAGEAAKFGMVYRFADEELAGELFHRTRGVPGLEGVVGRLLAGPYVQGETETMAKARWKRA